MVSVHYGVGGIGMITAMKIWMFSATLFVLLIVSVYFGYHLGRQQRRRSGDNDNSGVNHMDMEYPRLGFIRVDLADRVLVDGLQGMRH